MEKSTLAVEAVAEERYCKTYGDLLLSLPLRSVRVFTLRFLTQHRSRQSIIRGLRTTRLNLTQLCQKLNPKANHLNSRGAISNPNLISQVWIAITNCTLLLSAIFCMKHHREGKNLKRIPGNNIDLCDHCVLLYSVLFFMLMFYHLE